MKQLLSKIYRFIINCSKLLAYYYHCTVCKEKRRKILTVIPVKQRSKRGNSRKGGNNHDNQPN